MKGTPHDPVVERLTFAAHRDPATVLRRVQAAWCERPGGLLRFVELMWPILEPARPFIGGWHLGAIAEHLEAVTNGEIKRLLINVPPGCMKDCWVEEPVLVKGRGRIRLGDVAIGDEILTHRGRYKTVLAVNDTGMQPTLKIAATSGREIVVQIHHPVLTTRGWIKASDLTLGDSAWIVAAPDAPLVEDPITLIADGGERECRCLSVDEDHSFTVNDIAVHNSLMTNVWWPAWEWGPMNLPSTRYLCFSYSERLTIRDNVKFRQLIMSNEYRDLWGERFDKNEDQFSLTTVGNNRSGFKMASSLGGVATGARGERLILDDPNNVTDSESDTVRESANLFFREALPSRLANPQEGAIVVIQQRVHASDISGTILDNGMDFVHLMIPMIHDGNPRTTVIGWSDPRSFDPATDDEIGGEGLLMWPEMYPQRIVDNLKRDMGPVAFAGQYQQIPVPRGGAIFSVEDWQPWPIADDDAEARWVSADGRIVYPPLEYICAFVDTAFTEQESNDPSAMVVLGVFRETGHRMATPQLQRSEEDPIEFLRTVYDERPKVLLMYAWQKRLSLHGPPEQRPVGVTDAEWNSPLWRTERQQNWGLVEHVADTCRRYHVDHLLVEMQGQGHGLAQELRRLHSHNATWGVELVVTKGVRGNSKLDRAWSVQHLFSNKLIYAPQHPTTRAMPAWCDQVIQQCAVFPKGKNDDLVDCITGGLRHLRDNGILVRGEEHDDDFASTLVSAHKGTSLYDV